MTIDELLKLEREYRKADKWLIFSDDVTNDNGVTVKVQLKSSGFYNQILRVGDNPVNYCSGHSISSAMLMKAHIRSVINTFHSASNESPFSAQ